MKIALLVAYDGTDLQGFARQREGRTVQGFLEESLSQLLRVDVRTTGAGRTDAGVHAIGQVVSFEAPVGTDPQWVADRLNKRLGPEIAVRAAAIVPKDFDARHRATKRTYEYRLVRASAPDPLRDRFTVWVPGGLNLTAMRRAAKGFVGEHDFSSFCRRAEGSMVRRLRTITFRPAEGDLVIRVVGDSFCHQMVRSIVGFLLEVGRGKRSADEVPKVLAQRDRGAAGPVAPAKGLTLVEVGYPRRPFARAAG
ncbi:MAG: tRNA pseudouridine(38-40) synthase TruA [Actinomycetota bacterium]